MARSYAYFVLRGLFFPLVLVGGGFLVVILGRMLDLYGLGEWSLIISIAAILLLFIACVVLFRFLRGVADAGNERLARARLASLRLDSPADGSEHVRLETVYDRLAPEHRDDVEAVQHTTMYTDGGLKPTHGVFGTSEWLSALESGLIAKVIDEGVVSRVYWTGHNDTLTFDMALPENRAKTFLAMGKASAYKVGKVVRVTAVIQELKIPDRVYGHKIECVLTIEIEA